jgi:hypothetical protein
MLRKINRQDCIKQFPDLPLREYNLYIAVFLLLIIQLPAAAQTKIHIIIKSARPVESVDAVDFSMTKLSESEVFSKFNFLK